MSRAAAATVRRCRPPAGRRQRGLSLVTALLFMVATLILGVSVMSINVMQERMIGNTKDRDLAMQAAEAGLRDAELFLRLSATGGGTMLTFADDCAGGLCTPPSQRAGGIYPSPLPVHKVPGFSWNVARRYGQGIADARDYPGVARQPQYVIEKVGTLAACVGCGTEDPLRVAYRITARGYGAREDTVVMLQSIYAMR